MKGKKEMTEKKKLILLAGVMINIVLLVFIASLNLLLANYDMSISTPPVITGLSLIMAMVIGVFGVATVYFIDKYVGIGALAIVFVAGVSSAAVIIFVVGGGLVAVFSGGIIAFFAVCVIAVAITAARIADDIAASITAGEERRIPKKDLRYILVAEAVTLFGVMITQIMVI